MFQFLLKLLSDFVGNRSAENTKVVDVETKVIEKEKVMLETGKVSEYISMFEVTHSNTAKANGIDNTPTPEELELIKELGKNVFDPLREHTGNPIKINSVYRSPELNAKIKGSATSQHCVGLDPSTNSYGAAIDIDDEYWKRGLNDFNNLEMGDWIRENLDTDQLIYELPVNGYPSWIHVSYRPDGKNRNQVLIYLGRGKGYIPYEGNEHLLVNPDLEP